MFASLVGAEKDDEIHLLKDGKTRATTGSTVSSLFRLKDLDNSDGGFFVFPDLSVRMEGQYRLKFSLFELVGKRVVHCASIFSSAFYVYPAKKFPGMEESTLLSRSFAEQGLKIRIRKELRVKKRQDDPQADEDDDDGYEPSPVRASKRPRRNTARKDRYSEPDEQMAAPVPVMPATMPDMAAIPDMSAMPVQALVPPTAMMPTSAAVLPAQQYPQQLPSAPTYYYSQPPVPMAISSAAGPSQPIALPPGYHMPAMSMYGSNPYTLVPTSSLYASPPPPSLFPAQPVAQDFSQPPPPMLYPNGPGAGFDASLPVLNTAYVYSNSAAAPYAYPMYAIPANSMGPLPPSASQHHQPQAPMMMPTDGGDKGGGGPLTLPSIQHIINE